MVLSLTTGDVIPGLVVEFHLALQICHSKDSVMCPSLREHILTDFQYRLLPYDAVSLLNS